MAELIEIGKISSRGQIAIPSDMRHNLGLEEGSKVLFLQEKNAIIIKKVIPESFAEITKPLKESAKKSGLKESDVVDIIHRMRKEKNEGNLRH